LMVIEMHLTRADILTMLGWGTVLGTIGLHTLYERALRLLLGKALEEFAFAPLRPLDLLLIFLVSVLAGAILLEPEKILIGYVSSFVLSGLIMFFGLSLPATLHALKFSWSGEYLDLFYSGSLDFTVRALLLGPIVICLIGGMLGGIFGERYA